jgi:hypothetical protein
VVDRRLGDVAIHRAPDRSATSPRNQTVRTAAAPIILSGTPPAAPAGGAW